MSLCHGCLLMGFTVCAIWLQTLSVAQGELEFTSKMRALADANGPYRSIKVTKRFQVEDAKGKRNLGAVITSEIPGKQYRQRVVTPGPESDPDGGRTKVASRNPDYAFRLRRRSDETDWRVLGFGAVTDLLASGESVQGPVLGDKADTSCLQFPSRIGDWIDLTDLESLPGFTVIEIGDASLEFEWGPPEVDHMDLDQPLSMTIWFDADNDWLPSRGIERLHSERANNCGTYYSECTWSMDGDRVISADFNRRYAKLGEPVEASLSKTYVTVEFEYDTLEPKDFTLSAYGLPEPSSPSHGRWWLFLILGVAFFAGIVVLGRRAYKDG